MSPPTLPPAASPSTPPRPLRFLSGLQPSGELHLGNYFGAIVQHLRYQEAGNSYYFIANYHALTTLVESAAAAKLTPAALLRDRTFDVAATYLALGLDPARSVLFRQSDVPEVTELTWLLLNCISAGHLERSPSYKDKVARGLDANAGLLVYPVLMAADILIYDSDVVPVGKDQVTHVEMARDLAGAFNAAFGEVFVVPRHQLSEAPYVIGTDGTKMSKSYNNAIPIFAAGKELKRRVNAIVTDSTPLEAPKEPEGRVAYEMMKLFAGPDELAEVAARYRAGNYGDGHAKQALMAQIDARFGPAREKKAWLHAHPEEVDVVLRAGAEKARAVARQTLNRARLACGLD
jgi:tryptophanyl-tRNA synthetase